jgi:hypothetical protein
VSDTLLMGQLAVTDPAADQQVVMSAGLVVNGYPHARMDGF